MNGLTSQPHTDEHIESVKVFIRLRNDADNTSKVSTPGLKKIVNNLTSKNAVEPKSPTPSLKGVSNTLMKNVGKTPEKSAASASVTGHSCIEVVSDTTLKLIKGTGSHAVIKEFTYDQIFQEDSTNEELYASISGHVQDAVHGYNSTIFTYGSTTSGKTHTMCGVKNDPGLIPKGIRELFTRIEASREADPYLFFYVEMSMVELYNNGFKNLLRPSSSDTHTASSAAGSAVPATPTDTSAAGLALAAQNAAIDAQFEASVQYPQFQHSSENPEKINIHESSALGVFLSGTHLRIHVKSAEEAMILVNRGIKLRTTRANKAAKYNSSRGHVVLTFHIESRKYPPESEDEARTALEKSSSEISGLVSPKASTTSSAELLMGRLQFVDLAGVERMSATGVVSSEEKAESHHINLSLNAVGDVLSTLVRRPTPTVNTYDSNGKAIKHNSSHSKLISSEEDDDNRSVVSVPNSTTGSTTNRKQSVSSSSAGPHIPYLNSKLTFYLKESFGGNTKTIFVFNILTSADAHQLTSTTLNYAQWAMKIKNAVSIHKLNLNDNGFSGEKDPEILRLKKILEERSKEFETLHHATVLKMPSVDAYDSPVTRSRKQPVLTIEPVEEFVCPTCSDLPFLTSQLEDCQLRNRDQGEDIERLTNALEQLQAQHDRDLQAIADSSNDSANELGVVKLTLETTAEDNKSLRKNVSALEKSLADLNDKLNACNGQCVDKDQLLRENAGQIAALQEQLNSLRNVSMASSQDVQRLQDDLAAKERANAEENAETARKFAELQALFNEKSQQLDAANAQVDTLTSEGVRNEEKWSKTLTGYENQLALMEKELDSHANEEDSQSSQINQLSNDLARNYTLVETLKADLVAAKQAALDAKASSDAEILAAKQAALEAKAVSDAELAAAKQALADARAGSNAEVLVAATQAALDAKTSSDAEILAAKQAALEAKSVSDAELAAAKQALADARASSDAEMSAARQAAQDAKARFDLELDAAKLAAESAKTSVDAELCAANQAKACSDTELVAKNKEIADLLAKLAALEQSLGDGTNMSEINAKELAALREALAAKEVEVETLRNRTVELRELLNEESRLLREALAKMDTMQSTHTLEVQRYTTTITSFTEQITTLETERNTLMVITQQNTQQNSTQTAELDTLRTEVAQLRAELADKQATYDSLLSTKNAAIASLNGELDELKRQLGAVSGKDREIKLLNATLHDMEGALASSRSDTEQVLRDAATKEDEYLRQIEQLSAQLAAKTSKMDALLEKSALISNSIDELTRCKDQEIATLKARNIDLDAELSIAKFTNKELTAQVAQLSTELQRLIEANAMLQLKCTQTADAQSQFESRKQAEIDELEHLLQSKHAELLALSEENERLNRNQADNSHDLQDQIAVLVNSLQNTTAALKTLQAQFASLQNTHNEYVAKSAKELSSANERVAKTVESLSHKANEVKYLQEENERLRGLLANQSQSNTPHHHNGHNDHDDIPSHVVQDIEALIATGLSQEQAIETYFRSYSTGTHSVLSNTQSSGVKQQVLSRHNSGTNELVAGDQVVNISAKKDPDQEALEHGILLSSQEAEFGINMYDSLTPEDDQTLENYQAQGFSKAEATLLVFEQKYGKVQAHLQSGETPAMPHVRSFARTLSTVDVGTAGPQDHASGSHPTTPVTRVLHRVNSGTAGLSSPVSSTKHL